MAITLSTNGYCELTDVRALCPHISINAASEPSDAEVEGFITERFAEIGGMLAGAGYTHPVAQIGGTLAVSAGTITAVEARDTGDSYIRLQGTGGTLSGIVRSGDFILIGSDAQRYYVTQWAEVGDDGEIVVRFSPGLESDVTAAATVTFTGGTGASQTLKRLNALGAGMDALYAAYSASGSIQEDYSELKDQHARLFKAISKKEILLLGADPIERAAAGSARILRA